MRRFWPLVSLVVVAVILGPRVSAQGEWLVPSDEIVLDGIPKIPATLGKVTEAFKAVLNDSLIGWDPVKPSPVIVRKGYDTWTVGLVEEPGGSPLVMVPAATYDVYSHPGGKYLLFRVDAGNEHYQLYRSNVDTSDATLLTDGKSTNLYPCWSNSGEWLMYSSNRRNGKDLDVYMINPLDPKSDRMVAKLEGEDWAVFDWSPDDKKVILSDLVSSNETYLWVLDLETGAKNLITPQNGREKVFNGSYAQFSRDGKGIYHLTDRDSDFQRLAYLDLETKRYRYLTNHIKWDVEEFVLSPDRTMLAFTTNEDGVSRLHVLNISTDKETPMPRIPVGVISGLNWHANGNLIGFALSSPSVPRSVYAIGLKECSLKRWTERNERDSSSQELPEPEAMRWKSFDGRQISGFLYRPPSHRFIGKRPVIIDIHGGPQLQSRPEFRALARYFASEIGVAMVFPNIRGSSGYGKTFTKLDNGALRDDCVKDIGTLLDWIKSQANLDSKRIMIRGVSYGGYVALSIAEKYNDSICGTIAFAAPSNLVTMITSSDK